MPEEHSSVAEEGWPSGTTLPLNSNCLNLVKWRAIAASLDLSTNATLTETCVIVEGKLTELETLQSELQIACTNALKLINEVASLKVAVKAEKLTSKRFWRLQCEQMLEWEIVLHAKVTEIAQLCEEPNAAKASPRPMSVSSPLFTTPIRINLTWSITSLRVS